VGREVRLRCSEPRRGDSLCPHTFANLLTHVIFSTEDRQPFLTPDLRPDLLAYLDGIVRKLRGKVIASNARPDHVHAAPASGWTTSRLPKTSDCVRVYC
jgi:hypothetical protein